MTVLRSEWLKIHSVRSYRLAIAVAFGGILLGLGLAQMAAEMYESASPAQQARASLAELEEVVLMVPQLSLGILGVLVMTSEYTTGLIRTSLTVVPRRWPMLAGKAAVVGVIGLVTGPAVVFGTHVTCRWVIGDRFSGLYQTAFADKLPLLVALSLTVPAFALLGLGMGAILRSAAGAIALLVGLLYVIPMIVDKFPSPWSEWLGSVMFGALPRQISGDLTTPGVYGTSLPPPVAAGLLACYAVLPVLAGAWLLRRRDA
ncbi:ABC transporter permease [Nonomuraea sp. MCN248]|uniref:ABC transporter permease n=1 Tax=Nonomuraea corallina TaxID=2989783 RepID=A0ABT4S9I1_9ACTN|nr:ABC transporter permease [Nonomuraea corallina]MDA0633844.1 ABC transporter permease [Nonomuraea corallina]